MSIHRKLIYSLVTFIFAYAVAEATAKNARVQRRGDPDDLGDEVPRKFIDLLGGDAFSQATGSGRLELARRLTDPKNPLTARVMVNRIWLGHFGRALVATPNDFGTRGAPPTHPDLLDHLAAEFVRSGWSIKEMHRRIMGSAAYQQAPSDSDHSRTPINPWVRAIPVESCPARNR